MYDDINTPYESIVSLGEAFAKYRKSLKISQQRLHERRRESGVNVRRKTDAPGMACRKIR